MAVEYETKEEAAPGIPKLLETRGQAWNPFPSPLKEKSGIMSRQRED